MAMKRPGIYAPLSAHYFDDSAVMEAGEDAELLYVRMLAYAARQMEFEGFISDRVIVSRLGILPRESGNGTGNVPGTDAQSRARTLADVGLLTREADGYRISGWLKWNRSAEELGKERVRDRARKSAGNALSGNGAGTDTGNTTGPNAGVGKQRPDQTKPDTNLSSSTNADASEDGRDDVDSLCSHLAERIIGNGNKPPTITQAWKRSARLMLDRDSRNVDDAHALIDWCQSDSFWMSNILSMPKFREKYDQLRLRAGAAVARAVDDEDDWVEPVEDRSAYEAYDAQMRALEEANR